MVDKTSAVYPVHAAVGPMPMCGESGTKAAMCMPSKVSEKLRNGSLYRTKCRPTAQPPPATTDNSRITREPNKSGERRYPKAAIGRYSTTATMSEPNSLHNRHPRRPPSESGHRPL